MQRGLISLLLLMMISAPGWAQGPGSALRFDGSSTFAQGGNINFGFVSTVTFSAWVKWNQNPTTGVANATVMALNSSAGNGTDGQFWLQHNSGNTAFQAAVRTSSGRRVVTGTTAPANGSWYHVAGVFDGTRLRIYVNGVEEGSDTLSGGIVTTSTSDIFSIGQWSNATGSYRRINADVDEARVWTTALSASDLRGYMCRHLPGGVSGLAGYWRFDTGSGSTVLDHSGNGRNLALSTPAPTWQCSSAPVGDASANTYASSWNGVEITLAHPSGDYLQVASISGAPTGIHIYRIDTVASDPNPPGNLSLISTHRHWGVFAVGGTNVTFRTRYYYLDSNDKGHPGISAENQLRLAYRQDDCSTWSRDNGTPNTNGNYLQQNTPYFLPQFQIILGSLNSNNTLDYPSYTWIGGNGSWSTGSNWSPGRYTRTSDDILIFDNYNNGAVTVTDVLTETIAKLRLENGAAVTLLSSDDRTLTLGGGPNDDFIIAAGSSLTIDGARDLAIRLSAGVTASLAGSLITTGQGKPSLDAATAGSIRVRASGIIRQEASGAFFTQSGTANVAVFHSGSRFEFQSTQADARSPFGLSSPNSKVVFESGSTYAQRSNLTNSFELPGRSYANVEFSDSVNYSVAQSFSSTASIDTLSILQGSTLQLASGSSGTGVLTLHGDLCVDGSLQYANNSGVQHTLRFAGTVAQRIRGAGAIVLPANLTGLLIDAPDVRLARDLEVSAPLLLNSGNLRIGSHMLSVRGNLNRTNGTLIGDSTSTLEFAGSASNITCPPITLGNLIVNRSATVALGGTVRVASLLSLTTGTLSIGSDTLVLAGAITQTGGTLFGGSTANLLLEGSVGATIPAVTLGMLDMNKSGGVTLAGNLEIHTAANLHNGIINVGSHVVLLRETALIGGTPSSTSMFATDGSGVLRRFWSADGSFTFPVGDHTGNDEYSPISVTLAGASYAAGAYVDAAVKNTRHPAHSDPSNYLNRHWVTASSGITTLTASIVATYATADVVGLERRMSAAEWDGSNWAYFGAADTLNNQLRFVGLASLSTYTGKDEFPYLAISTQDGSWQDAGTWDVGRVPLSTDSVMVRHTVTLASNAYCSGLLIDASGILSHGGIPVALAVYGGWSNNGSVVPGLFMAVVLHGRADTVFGIAGSNPSTFASLTLNAAYSIIQDIECLDLLSIPSGSACHAGSAVITLKGAPTGIAVDGGWDSGTSTVRFAAGAQQDVPPLAYHNLETAAGSGMQLRTLLGDVTIGGTLTLSSGARLSLSSHRVDLKGFSPLVFAGGVLEHGTSTIAYSLPDSQQVISAEYHTLLLSAEGGPAAPPVGKALTGDITVHGDLIVDSLVTFHAGSSTVNVQGGVFQRGNEVGTMPSHAGRIAWTANGTLRYFGSGNSLLMPNNSGQHPDILNLTLEKSSITDTLKVVDATGPSTALRIAAGANFSIVTGVLDYGDVPFVPEQLELATLSVSSGAIIRTSGQHNFPLSSSSAVARFATNSFQSGSRVEFYGSAQEIPGADHNINSYSTLLLDGDGTKTLTDDVAIADSLILRSAADVSRAGNNIVYAPGATLKYQIASDSIPSRQLTQTSGQEFDPTFAPTNLVVDNRKAIVLGASHAISGTVTLEDGYIMLGDFTLGLGNTASIAGAGPGRCFVTNGSGALRRDGVSSAQVSFPIGTIDASTSDTTYNPVTISNSGTTDAFSVRVQSSIDNPPMFTDVVVNRQWSIEEGTPGGSNASITFQWNSAEQGASFDPTGSVVVNYHSSTWNEESAIVFGSGPYAATAQLSTISKYFVSMATPLPVELLAFSGKRSGSSVDLAWTTATELFNLGFEIQRSTDGIQWHVVGFVDGNGTTSSPRDYSFSETLTGTAAMVDVIAYRLRQVDGDGTFSYSWILRLVNNRASDGFALQSAPNPLRARGLLSFHLPAPMTVRIDIYDSMGRRVARLLEDVAFPAGTHTIPLDMAQLPSGMYFCVMQTPHTVRTHRVLLAR